MRATAAATLALMDPEWGTKMPLFIMAPGALATFSGSDLCHGTTEHLMMCGTCRGAASLARLSQSSTETLHV